MASLPSVIWYFSHTVDKSQKVAVVGLESARCVVALMDREQQRLWRVRCDGGDFEEPVCDCQLLFAAAAPANNSPKKDPNSYRTVDLGPVSKALMGPAGAPKFALNRRAHKRIKVKLSVMIVKGKEIFNGIAKDISLGGLLITTPLPASFLNSKCKVIICSSEDSLNVHFEVKILEISGHGTRIMFDAASEQSLATLQKWLNEKEFGRAIKLVV